jgi:hypothetical protein
MSNQATCDCCQGVESITPQETAQRPGLDVLNIRIGTHAAFLRTMGARLASMPVEVPRQTPDERGAHVDLLYPLQGLTTRSLSDPAIALLDGWATVADVLTFYQARIANEGYLRTATERRSVLELARLVGYTLRPGVAASVHLAYLLEPTFADPVAIPVGARVQSVPGPGELPQSFETSEPIEARAIWNTLKPRLTRLQTRQSIENDRPPQSRLPQSVEEPAAAQPAHQPRLYLKGTATNLKAGDPLLVDLGDGPALRWVQAVQPQAAQERTVVYLQPWKAAERVVRPLDAPDLSELAEFSARQGYVSQVREVLERYLDLDAFHVDPDSAMAGRVVAQLKVLMSELRDDTPPAELTIRLNQELLPALRIEQMEATEANYRWLQPWVSGLVRAIEEAMTLATDQLASAAALAFAAPAVDPFTAPQPMLDETLVRAISGLTRPPSLPPANALQFARNVETAFAATGDIGLQVAGTFAADLRSTLPATLATVQQTAAQPIRVYALRTRAAPFGHNAPLRSRVQQTNTGNVTRYEEWLLNDPQNTSGGSGPGPIGDAASAVLALPAAPIPQPAVLYLDAEYNLQPESWVVIAKADYPDPLIVALGASSVTHLAVAGYGLSGKSTRLALGATHWIDAQATFGVLRSTVVYAQSELLELAEEPYEEEVGGALIELADLYSGLQSGRWLIVAGERTDIQVADPNDPATLVALPGIRGAELVMLDQAFQDVQRSEQREPARARDRYSYGGYGTPPDDRLPGDTIHTFLKLAEPLRYTYKRDTVTVYGNVVKATHGETRTEVLGSGDGSKALQTFALRQPPLTYLAANTPAGAESTLEVYVNDLRWHEATALAGLRPTDRRFITRTDDESKTSVIFGTGREGARLPTGRENVKARYRNGIGKLGNVRAEQITLLATRPLGVQGVINPLRASGGADRESRDQARRNAPLAVMALDRLVSVQDYADFARTFAGIGKAVASRLVSQRHELVHLTIAGAEDIPIDTTSDLYRHLTNALRTFGHPDQPLRVESRELKLVVISAKLRLLPDYLWEPVVTQVRTTLLERFSFERRELGQDVPLSEVISAMQRVAGVAYVDVDLLAGIDEKVADPASGSRRLRTPTEITAEIGRLLDGRKNGAGVPGSPATQPAQRLTVNLAGVEAGLLRPAQLAFLSPDLPDTLILNQIT